MPMVWAIRSPVGVLWLKREPIMIPIVSKSYTEIATRDMSAQAKKSIFLVVVARFTM
jgi:hypothetical protein